MPKVPNTVQLANLAIVGLVYACGAVGVLHFLNREYDAVSQPLSYYMVGASSWLMTSVLGAHGERAGCELGEFHLRLLTESISRTRYFSKDRAPKTRAGASLDLA
jgi:hypothetical protein